VFKRDSEREGSLLQTLEQPARTSRGLIRKMKTELLAGPVATGQGAMVSS